MNDPERERVRQMAADLRWEVLAAYVAIVEAERHAETAIELACLIDADAARYDDDAP